MPSMAITASKHRAENPSVLEAHEDRPGWCTSTELMYIDVRYVDFASLLGCNPLERSRRYCRGAQKSVTPKNAEKYIFSAALICFEGGLKGLV
jgi:hypothetical protein